MRVLWYNRFIQPTQLLAAPGAIALLGDMAKDAGYHKALVVHGGSVKKNGTLDKITDELKEAGIVIVYYDKVQPDPPANLVDEGAALVRAEGCDCVIAVGGGSAIDTAKCINLLRGNEGKVLDYAQNTTPRRLMDGLICVPTTSGTGSEMTNSAVVTDTANAVKCVVSTGRPTFAIIDPTLTLSLSASQTLYTGLDAFSHAAEGYTSPVGNIMSDPLCEKVMETIVEALPRAISDGSDLEARTQMHVAASTAGMIIANTACHMGHSMAHVVGGKLHIVHGALCAYDLPVVLKYVAPHMPTKVRRIGEILGAKFDGSETPEQIGEKTAEAYKGFVKSIGLKPVSYWGKQVEDIDALAEGVLHEPLRPAWPVQADHNQVVALLREMLEL